MPWTNTAWNPADILSTMVVYPGENLNRWSGRKKCISVVITFTICFEQPAIILIFHFHIHKNHPFSPLWFTDSIWLPRGTKTIRKFQYGCRKVRNCFCENSVNISCVMEWISGKNVFHFLIKVIISTKFLLASY